MKKYLHYIIGLAIMFGFRLIPEGVLPGVTPIGLSILGIFIGTIYLWSTVDPLTSSLICLVMVAFSGFAPIPQFTAGALGAPVVVQLFFLMIFIAGLTNRRVTDYIGRYLITRKFIEGRPWVFTAVILYGTFLISLFVNAFTPIFLFWPVIYSVAKEVGFEKDAKYVKLLLHAIVICALIGFPVPPYMSNGLALLANYRGLIEQFPNLAAMGAGIMVSDASYFIACFTFGAVLVAIVIALMKFVWRPDVSPLKNVTVEMINRNPLPPMNKAQKCYAYFLGIFIAIMLLPSLLPTLPVLSFLNKNSLLLGALLVTILCVIKFDDGPVLRMGPTMGEFAWPTYWLCVSAIYLGNVLTDQSTGITILLNTIMGPIFNGMSTTVFTVVVIVVCMVLTNISNSLVIGMIMQPVILTFCNTAGINPAPIISLMIFAVLSSACATPAASPFAAMLFGNKEYLSSGEVYKFSGLFIIVELLFVLLIGMPFFNILIG